MRVLVCGASGCIGRAVVRSLRWRGHRVVEAGRCRGEMPTADRLDIDFMQPTLPEAWAALLAEHCIDAVVNCVGILMSGPRDSFERVHRDGPNELFRGARLAGVRRVVQVSALGVGVHRHDDDAEPPYLRSKRAADEALLALDLDTAVVRPSLVYGPGSHSAALFAVLSRLPVIGLPGRGDQPLQPIHVFEVAEAIAVLVERTGSASGIYELGGGAVVSYRQMLAAYRNAQGHGRALWLPLPMALMTLAAIVAEWLPQKVFSRDTLRLLRDGNVCVRNAAPVLLGRAASPLAVGLEVTPPRRQPPPPVSRRAPLRPASIALSN
ncbi:MAG: NAD-dependent epimerase/dehydratase family protein [Caldimonas sp.]